MFEGIARTHPPCPPSRRVAERPSRLLRELAADYEEPPEPDNERLGAKVYIERLKEQKGFVVRAAVPVVQRTRTLHNVWLARIMLCRVRGCACPLARARGTARGPEDQGAGGAAKEEEEDHPWRRLSRANPSRPMAV